MAGSRHLLWGLLPIQDVSEVLSPQLVPVEPLVAVWAFS